MHDKLILETLMFMAGIIALTVSGAPPQAPDEPTTSVWQSPDWKAAYETTSEELRLAEDELARQADQLVDLDLQFEQAECSLFVAGKREENLMTELSDSQLLVASFQAERDHNDQTITDLRADLWQAIVANKRIESLLAGETEAKQRLEEEVKKLLTRMPGELLNVVGELDRVVFLIDKSGSMETSKRWQEVVETISTCIRYLPMRECVFILFDDQTQLLRFNRETVITMNPTSRTELLRYLTEVIPGGRTNTLAALQQAYEVRGVSSIYLFTDGEPSLTGHFDPQMASQTLDLCKKMGKSAPINVFAVGDYFDSRFGRYLLDISKITGGSFRGR